MPVYIRPKEGAEKTHQIVWKMENLGKELYKNLVVALAEKLTLMITRYIPTSCGTGYNLYWSNTNMLAAKDYAHSGKNHLKSPNFNKSIQQTRINYGGFNNAMTPQWQDIQGKQKHMTC
jgi:hypothetical protein